MLFAIFKNTLLPRTLYGRSLLIIVTPLILLQIVSTWIFYDRHWDTITKRLAAAIAGDVSQIVELLGSQPDAARREAIFDMAWRNLGLQVDWREDAALGPEIEAYEARIDFFLSEFLKTQFPDRYRIDTSDYRRQVTVKIQMDNAVMSVLVPGKRLFSVTTYIFIMWMVGTSLVLFAVASIFMRNQVRPIQRLAEAANRFGRGQELDEDFKPEGALEVRRAATAFNVMRQRIRRQIRQRTDMLSGVSHDLRTPITRMKLQLAMLPEDSALADLKDDIAEMERMIEGYLTFARGEGDEPGREVDLTQVIEDIAAAWRRNGLKIDCHVEQSLDIWLRPDAVGRSINNLVANAGRYGTQVWIRAGRRGGFIEVTVDDDGPGIPEAQREEVFRPFYRLDESRNPETGGTGLGLAIARDLVRSHGGDIMLEDSPHGGLRARIRLPG